jgi:hypothetical protein
MLLLAVCLLQRHISVWHVGIGVGTAQQAGAGAMCLRILRRLRVVRVGLLERRRWVKLLVVL